MGRLKLMGATLWVLGAMALAGTLYLGVQSVGDVHLFSIQNIEVQGTVYTTPEKIIAAAGLAPGQDLFAKKINELTRRVTQVDWVREVRVSRRLPSTLLIEVEEHEPRYLVQLDRLYYMSIEGQVVDAPLEAGLDYPVVTGISWARLEAPGADRAALLALLALLDRNDIGGAIDEVHYDAELGFTLYGDLPQTSGIHMGWGEWEEKFDRLARLRTLLDKRGQYATSVDLTYDDRIVARLAPLSQRGLKQ